MTKPQVEARSLELIWFPSILLMPSSCQLPSLCELDTLRQRADPRIQNVAFLLELHTFVVEICQRHSKSLNELSGLETWLRILILWERHVDRDLDHLEVRVAEAGIWGRLVLKAYARDVVRISVPFTCCLSVLVVSLTVEHNGTDTKASFNDFTHIARLFLQLADCTLLCAFARVHQASWDLDHYCIGGCAPLLL